MVGESFMTAVLYVGARFGQAPTRADARKGNRPKWDSMGGHDPVPGAAAPGTQVGQDNARSSVVGRPGYVGPFARPGIGANGPAGKFTGVTSLRTAAGGAASRTDITASGPLHLVAARVAERGIGRSTTRQGLGRRAADRGGGRGRYG